MRSLFWYKSTHRYYIDSLYGGTRRYHWTYTFITELILNLLIQEYPYILQNLSLYYRAYSCSSDLIWSLFLYKSTRRYYTDSLYEGTRRYYWTYTYFTNTGVLVGTTKLILILLIREYPWVLQNLYLFY